MKQDPELIEKIRQYFNISFASNPEILTEEQKRLIKEFQGLRLSVILLEEIDALNESVKSLRHEMHMLMEIGKSDRDKLELASKGLEFSLTTECAVDSAIWGPVDCEHCKHIREVLMRIRAEDTMIKKALENEI